MEIPKEPSKYTTVYSDFKGVDFTNDSTNVFKRRSPDAVNMTPGFDGKPRKRHGWEIKFTKNDFVKLYNQTTGSSYIGQVIPERMHYFELGGVDWIAIFNNLGLFFYDGNKLICAEAGKTFDAKRSFFFEGEGEAGFYMFSGLDVYRFDGKQIKKKTPYIPTTLIGTSPLGESATTFESVNLLTPYMTVQYIPDGTTAYTIPGGATAGTLSVETMNKEGAWVKNTGWKAITDGDKITRVDFTVAPALATEDKVRLTYLPAGVNITVTQEEITRDYVTIKITHKGYQTRDSYTGTNKAGKLIRHDTAWSGVYWTGYTIDKNPTFDISGIYKNEANKTYAITPQYLNTDGEAATLPDTCFNYDFTSYANKVALKIKASTLYLSDLHAESNTTTYGNAYNYGEKVPIRKAKDLEKANKALGLKGNAQYKICTKYPQRRSVTRVHTYKIRIKYTKQTTKTTDMPATNKAREAFQSCQKVAIYGNGIINQVFMGATTYPEYTSRLWYSNLSDPTYFPDTNYIEVGSTDTAIMGMIKVDEYLGVIKQGKTLDSSIYLAYPTSFQNDTTYAVKQSLPGIGAISNGAFNLLNSEALFLSSDGVMGIEVSEDETKTARNRSYYINKNLLSETNLQNAISFTYDGMYLLALNNHVYVLDGAQKSSWANEKTNLQYECYYWENVPAKCFARMDDELYFADNNGNLCRFKTDNDKYPYFDDYSVDGDLCIAESSGEGELTAKIVTQVNVSANVNVATITAKVQSPQYLVFKYEGDKWYLGADEVNLSDYGITATGKAGSIIGVIVYQGEYAYGYPIYATWATIADDDGTPQFYKNLQKKGTMVILEPSSDSGVEVYLKADDKEPIYVGKTDASGTLPTDYYTKKKVKKYKRLQIKCVNNGLLDSFGIDQIIKTYTVGNFSKNR